MSANERNPSRAGIADGIEDDALDELLLAAYEQEKDEHASPRPSSGAGLIELDSSRYRDFRTIGVGGMGVVFLAFDTELNRPVAVKVVRVGTTEKTGSGGTATPFDMTPPPEDSDTASAYAELSDRFLQEAWLTGALEHPGIVPIYELGTTPRGVPYYTMRYVKGVRTLKGALAEATTLGERLELIDPFLQVCDAVRYAHSQGVIHRDLKPANIGLGEFGEVVVLDWGLAKMRDEPDTVASVWQDRIRSFRDAREMETVASALGTPGYMSPEAARGRVADVDERSDVYSLAVILYEILTGKMPVRFESYAELLENLNEESAIPASTVEPSISHELSQICARALSIAREDRYAGAGELATAVRVHQRESRVRSEIRGFLQQAEDAVEAAQQLEGETRLRQLDRVTALCHRVIEHRWDHARAHWLIERGDQLRVEAREQRELQIQAAAEDARLASLAGEREQQRVTLRRLGAAVLLVFALGTAVAALVFDKQADEARAQEAEALAILKDLGFTQGELGTAQGRIKSERAARAVEVAELNATLDAMRIEAEHAGVERAQLQDQLTSERETHERLAAELEVERERAQSHLEDAEQSRVERSEERESSRKKLEAALASLREVKLELADERRAAKQAAEAAKQDVAAEASDLRTPGRELLERFTQLKEEPDPGWGGREHHAWKLHIKDRAPKLVRRVNEMLGDTRWVFSADRTRATALDSSSWSATLRAVASLQRAIAPAVRGYGSVRVSERSARTRWDRDHPIPDSIKETPSYPALAQAEATPDKVMRVNGKMVGHSSRAAALREKCEDELAAMRVRWKFDKVRAYARIEREANATRQVLRERRAALLASMKVMRTWLASMQQSEEKTLAAAIEALEGDVLEEAKSLLADMRGGRKFARNFYGDSAAAYDKIVRQGWATPREKILALLKDQQRRDAKARAKDKARDK